MKRTKKASLFGKIISLLVAATLVLGLLPISSALAAWPAAETTITIYHTNDVHGKFVGNAAYVKGLKDATPNSLLLDAGDATQGVAIASYSKGASIIQIMNAVGYDAMALGNHEFDYGAAVAKTNAGLASFPVLAANVLKDGQPFLQGVNGGNGCYTIKEVAGVKIGIFGITTHETAYKTNPANLQGVTFASELDTTRQQIAALKAAGADVVVGLMHVGIDSSSSPTSTDIATALGTDSGLDIIIDGHSHSDYVGQAKVNGITIAQAKTGFDSYGGTAIGKIEIVMDGAGITSVTSSGLKLAELKAAAPDSSVTALEAQLNNSLRPVLSEIVGKTEVPLWGATGSPNAGRLTETNLGNLVADSMVWGAKQQLTGEAASLPVVALANGGGIRISIPAGFITVEDINQVLPFGNSLAFLEVTPSVLFEILENSVKSIAVPTPGANKISGADGRFGQISGMRFEYDAAADAGSRIKKVVLLNADGSDGAILDKADSVTKIVFVANDFQLGGGDGYSMLSSLPTLGEGGALDVVFADYVRKLCAENSGTLSVSMAEGRIKEISANYSFDSTYAFTFSLDTALAGKTVSFTVDGAASGTGTVAADGKATLTGLSSGAHSVGVSVDGKQVVVYANNRIGAVGQSVTLAAAGSSDAKKMDDAIQYADGADKTVLKDLYLLYDEMDGASKALVVNGDLLMEKIYRFATKLTSGVPLEEILSGVILEDKDDVLPEGIRLVVESPSAEGTAALGKLGDVLIAYELYLVNNDNVVYQLGSGEKVTIKVPVPEGADSARLKVIHRKADGTTEEMKYVLSDGYAVFEASDFSVYGLVNEKAAPTGDASSAILYTMLFAASLLLAAGVYGARKLHE